MKAQLYFLGFCLFLSFSTFGSDKQHKELKQVADWVLPSLDGESYSLYEELAQDKIVVMVFWASWCKFCEELLLQIDALNKSDSTNKLRFFALNIWESGDPGTYISERDITLSVLLNADYLAKTYKILGTPGIIAVSPDKTIIFKDKLGDSTKHLIGEIQKLPTKLNRRVHTDKEHLVTAASSVNLLQEVQGFHF